MVINLSIANNPDRPVFVRHWLLSVIQINDTQTAVPKAHAMIQIDTFPIRAPVNNGRHHPLKHLFLDPEGWHQGDNSYNTAHTLSIHKIYTINSDPFFNPLVPFQLIFLDGTTPLLAHSKCFSVQARLRKTVLNFLDGMLSALSVF